MSTFRQHVEILGHDGYKPPGWPLSFDDSTFQGSPMLYDIDGDGTNDVGVVDKDGNLFWIRIGNYGEYMEDYHIQVPKLKIKRDWASGLDPKFTDNYVMMSMFDHKSDRDSRKYSYSDKADKPLFSKDEKKTDKFTPLGKIKADDLGIRPIKQESYPELNKNINSEKKPSEAVQEGSASRRRLQSVEEDFGDPDEVDEESSGENKGVEGKVPEETKSVNVLEGTKAASRVEEVKEVKDVKDTDKFIMDESASISVDKSETKSEVKSVDPVVNDNENKIEVKENIKSDIKIEDIAAAAEGVVVVPQNTIIEEKKIVVENSENNDQSKTIEKANGQGEGDVEIKKEKDLVDNLVPDLLPIVKDEGQKSEEKEMEELPDTNSEVLFSEETEKMIEEALKSEETEAVAVAADLDEGQVGRPEGELNDDYIAK